MVLGYQAVSEVFVYVGVSGGACHRSSKQSSWEILE